MRAGSRARRVGASAAAIGLGSALAVVALLHAPFARRLLARAGGCPIAGMTLSPEQADAARRAASAGERGRLRAPARPALRFTLDETRVADVRAWAAQTGVECKDPRKGLMICAPVPAAALGSSDPQAAVDELALEFDAQGRLVNETAWRSHLGAEAGASFARRLASSLEAVLGPPQTRAGDFDAARFARPGAPSVSTLSYRYSDYFADVTAMNLPFSGTLLREHYMAAAD